MIYLSQPMSRNVAKKRRSMPRQYSKMSFVLATFAKSGSVSCALSDMERPNVPIEANTPAINEWNGSLLIRTPYTTYITHVTRLNTMRLSSMRSLGGVSVKYFLMITS